MAEASFQCVRHDVPFMIESDSLDYAIAAILSQYGKPAVYMSKTLNNCEAKYPAIEKGATAVIEAVRKWSHF